MNIGNPIENSGESTSTHTYEDDLLEDTIKQHYKRMIAQVRIK
jgi:hypothetical protein